VTLWCEPEVRTMDEMQRVLAEGELLLRRMSRREPPPIEPALEPYTPTCPCAVCAEAARLGQPRKKGISVLPNIHATYEDGQATPRAIARRKAFEKHSGRYLVKKRAWIIR
jgi:hypothetical protein